MASGFLGSANLAAATDTLLYTVPVGKTATLNIRLANRNSATIQVCVAIGLGASPALTDYITYELTMLSNGVYEDLGQVASAGEKVWVRSSLANVSVRVQGFEV